MFNECSFCPVESGSFRKPVQERKHSDLLDEAKKKKKENQSIFHLCGQACCLWILCAVNALKVPRASKHAGLATSFCHSACEKKKKKKRIVAVLKLRISFSLGGSHKNLRWTKGHPHSISQPCKSGFIQHKFEKTKKEFIIIKGIQIIIIKYSNGSCNFNYEFSLKLRAADFSITSYLCLNLEVFRRFFNPWYSSDFRLWKLIFIFMFYGLDLTYFTDIKLYLRFDWFLTNSLYSLIYTLLLDFVGRFYLGKNTRTFWSQKTCHEADSITKSSKNPFLHRQKFKLKNKWLSSCSVLHIL